MKKRIISLFIATAMFVSFIPASFAEYETDNADESGIVFDNEQTADGELFAEIEGIEAETKETSEPIDLTEMESTEDNAETELPDDYGQATGSYFIAEDGLYDNNTLIDEGTVTWLIDKNGAVYWSKLDGNNTDIYKKNLSGNETAVLTRVFVPVEAFDISGDELYYLYDGEITKVNVLTDEEETIGIYNEAKGFYIKNESIRLIEHDINRNTTSNVISLSSTLVNINDPSVFLKQGYGTKTCVLVSCLMMFRRGALINNNPKWKSFNESQYTWKWTNNGYSVTWNPSGEGMYGNTYMNDDKEFLNTKGNVSGRITYFKKMLDKHPEGMVIYSTTPGKEHAILLTDYDKKGVFYCADPSPSVGKGRIRLDNSSLLEYVEAIAGVKPPEVSSQDYILANVNQHWRIDSGINYGSGIIIKPPSISSGTVTKDPGTTTTKPPTPPVDKNVYINLTRAPGNGFKPQSFSLGGTISSAYPIYYLTAILTNVDTGKQLIHWDGSTNTRKYNIAGSTLDKAVKFSNIKKSGNYRLRIIATNSLGESKYIDHNFTAVAAIPAAPMPNVKVSSIEGGQRVTVSSSDTSARLHMWSKLGEKSGTGSIAMDFKKAGSYQIDGWSSNSGGSSAKNSKTVSVKKMKTPKISNPSYGNSSATVTISGEGTIYYTTNGSNPTKNSTKYTGPISLTGTKTIKAVSIKNGCVNSDIASKEIKVSKPDAPKVSLYNTKSKIAKGKTATVSWGKSARATKYTATLYYNDEVVKTYSTKGTKAAFALSQAGKYTIKVTADNFKGSSNDSNSITVESMAPVTVTFVDRIDRTDGVTDDTVAEIQQRINEHDGENAELIEGNIISKQLIDYDTKPKKPVTPSKKGFTFSGYGEGLYSAATEDKTIYANYEIKYYTVDFYDTSTGTPSRIGDTQEIMYTDSAVPPLDYQTPAGYELTGWSVDNSKSTGYDYTYVDGNIVLQTAYAWANIDLPVFVEISKLVRDNNSYRVDLKLKNNPVEDTQGRIVVALYTSEGKNIYTQISEFDLDLGVQNNWTALDTITLLCTEKAAYAKAFIVAVENDKTGGALSAAAECKNITYDTGSHFWSDWSNWSTTAVTASDSRIVEKKTQYRSQTKSTTTSTTTKKLSGWTYDSTKSTTGKWSSWSKTKVNAVKNDALKREVQSEKVPAVTHTQYRYGRYCNDYNISACLAYGQSVDSRGSWYLNYSPWVDAKVPYDTSILISCSGGSSHNHLGVDWSEGGVDHWYRFWVNGNIYYFLFADTRQKTDVAAYTKYRYRDTTYVHSFYKWSAWSGWSDTKATATATKNVQTRTMYRYKTSGADDNEKESETLYRYHKTGNLDNISEDLSGSIATVMIYKKTNTDPTQEQIEYIDQITIGENNSYEINANTKEMLDYNNTGDFVVTLALEGGKRLINIDLIKAEVPTYDVTFYDAEGNQFGEIQKVRQGDSVDLNQIDIPTKEGYRFVKWNKSVVNVSSDLSVSPIFEPETFTVAFVDHENETTVFEEYNYGESIVLPMIENIEGKTFDGWDGVSDTDETIVTGSTVVTAKWIPIKYHVTFCDFDGNPVGETQEVEYGETAEMPDFVEKDGIAYSWDLTDGEWWNVTSDMTIRPYIPQEVEVEQPTISVPTEEAYGTFTAELYTENEGNKIYYTIDEIITEAEAEEFASQKLLELNDSSTVTLQETDVTENDEYNSFDEAVSITDSIREYSDPITINEGSIVYAFAADGEGNVSSISEFNYEYDWDAIDEGAVSNEYEPDPDVPQITMPTVNTNAGETVTVPVTMKNNMGIANLEMILDYDTEGLILEDIKNGEVFADNEFSYDIQDDESLKITWGTSSNNTKDGILMYLTFTVNASAKKSKYMLNLAAEYSGDRNGEEWYFVIVPGAIIKTGTSNDYTKVVTESVLSQDNKSLSVKIDAESEYSGIMFAAVYNTNGILEQLKQISVQNSEEVYGVEFDQAVTPNQTIKIFVWKDIKSLLPLSDVETISVTENPNI